MTTLLPNFDPSAFQPKAPINNLYFPLEKGTVSVYKGEPANGEKGDKELSRFATTFQSKDIAGVKATVVRDTVWANGFLREDTDDFFAQDKTGNVWYLGESTTSFEYDESGNFIGTNNDGSWEAGVNGARPGYVMPINPQVGDNYYQENAPNDQALDQAKVTSRRAPLKTEAGAFGNGLQTLEFTELTPGASDYKYYAPGIGLVRVEELDKNGKPMFVVERDSITAVTPDFFTSGRGTKGNDTIDGNNQANQLYGYQGDDLLQGFGGTDWLLGQDGNDFLLGGDGADKLEGGRGKDILVGGRGGDVLKGGEGRDQFVFRTLAERGDVIKDFAPQDVIVLAEIFNSPEYSSASPIDDYLQIKQIGSSTVIQIDLDGSAGSHPFDVLATLQNTSANSLGAANFVV